MIWILLVIYQLKHFLADYPLQGKFMLGKFKPYPDFILPLFCHAGVHGLFTYGIALFFKPHLAIWLGALDLVIHGVVDWIKANPSIGGRFNALSKKEAYKLMSEGITPKQSLVPSTSEEIAATWKSNTYFWWALGADQLAHHLTHYLLIWLML